MLNRFTITGGIFIFILMIITYFAEPVITEPVKPTAIIEQTALYSPMPKPSADDALNIACGSFMAWGEARNQEVLGARIVLEKSLNRVDSKYYPDNWCSVIFQKAQFSFANEGDPNRNKTFAAFLGEDDKHTRRARKLAYEAYYRPRSERITVGMHYHTVDSNPPWGAAMKKRGVKTIIVGDHKMYSSQKP